VYAMNWQFFNHHLEPFFMKVDSSLIHQVMNLFVVGMADTTFEVQTDSTNCINAFCEFVHERLKRVPTKQSAFLVNCVQNFYQLNLPLFQRLLRTIIYTLLFEH